MNSLQRDSSWVIRERHTGRVIMETFSRKIIARMDATELLRFYARMQAVKVIEYWDTEPPEVVCDYLMTGDENIRAAARAAANAEFNALVYESFAEFL